MLEEIDPIREKAGKEGIVCERPVFKPLHSNIAAFACPNSDKAYVHGLSIPLYPSLLEEEIDHIVTRLRTIIEARHSS